MNCHAYPILGTAVLSRNGTRLIKLRNPWSIEYYKGPYSDLSDELTQLDREELDHEDSNEGIFLIRIEEYYSNILYTSMSYDVERWNHDYHLILDDDGSGSESR